MKNLPEQECPVFNNLVVRDLSGPVIIGGVRRIRSVGLSANVFENFEQGIRATRKTKKNGTKIKKLVGEIKLL